jgi:hypothetical protein
MKQLEQQVEALMGMVTNGQAHGLPLLPKGNTTESTTDSTGVLSIDTPTGHLYGPSQARSTSENLSSQSSETECATYDPVSNGLIDEETAVTLMDEFRNHYSHSFPFVVVDPSISVNTMRRQQPFLFLSMMAATAYKTPNIQRELAEEFRNEVAQRIVDCSHKGLETLQGLLIHSAYYQYFYHPGKQQLALMVQMCVATAQELGTSTRTTNRAAKASLPEVSLAEDRALLGTYYLAAA